MYTIEVPKRIHHIMSVFYFIGLWHHNDRNVFLKFVLRKWYLIVFALYAVLLLLGVVTKDNMTESLLILVLAIIIIVQNVRLNYILWKKDEILELVSKVGTHSIDDVEEYNRVNDKIDIYIKYVSYFVLIIFVWIVSTLAVFANERHIPTNFYCPWDVNESQTIYWIAFAFDACQIMLSFVCFLFNTIIWFLMMSCAIKFEILGNELKNLYHDAECNQNLCLKDLITKIRNHQELQLLTNRLRSQFADLFLIQIATSALAITGSIYVVAFIPIENPLRYWIYVVVLLYNFFDIFVVSYFGNEIKFSSNTLLNCLFNSNWMDQSQSNKRCIFIVMEVLKRPQQMIIGKMYPLDLEIFTNILKLAYSIFNVLQNLK